MAEKINHKNFFLNTYAVFKIKKFALIKKLGKPNFTSSSGSKYWYTKEGVYRFSTHWEIIKASTCVWRLTRDRVDVTLGFCLWQDFKKIEWDYTDDLDKHTDEEPVALEPKKIGTKKINIVFSEVFQGMKCYYCMIGIKIDVLKKNETLYYHWRKRALYHYCDVFRFV